MSSAQGSHRAVRGRGAATEPRHGRAVPGPRPADGRTGSGTAGSGAGGTGAARGRSGGAELLRRLLPQALVLAVLAGGTSAVVAHDKVVQLSVDGETTSLRTFASSVSELLEDQGVDVGARDLVAPAAHHPLADGDAVAVRFGRPMTLTVDGRSRRVWTTERTVAAALRQLGVRAEGAHLSTSRSKRIGRDGLELLVRTERALSVLADGRVRHVRTNAATVREALAGAGVVLGRMDTVSVPLRSFPRDGQTLSVQRVSAHKRVREEQIPFRTERVADPRLQQGTVVVERQGSPGVRRVTYEQRSIDGKRQKPRRLGAVVVAEPVTQLVKVGTRPAPTSVQGADGLNWAALAHCESGGRVDAVDPSGTYGGLYQFDTRTWQGVGGSGRPQDASAAEQTYRAKKLYVARGASPWPVCGRKLHR